MNRIKSLVLAFPALLSAFSASARAQSGVLASRSDVIVAEQRAERSNDAVLAAALRQRLKDGDFQVGDRVYVRIVSDTVHRDTLIVRAGRVLELPGKILVPLSGVLRSELKEKVEAEVNKYIINPEIEVTPLTRIGVLGEVAHPGFFAFSSDTQLADAIMTAGGPTAMAEMERSVVKRSGQILRPAEETRTAITRGATIDQFGLAAGDELVIGRRREFNPGPMVGLIGAAVSLVTVFLALHH